ncbi:MAG: DUF4258 domain-containing protein [bacterium]|nr:DUF4258 domain-containing protein [bacterium]
MVNIYYTKHAKKRMEERKVLKEEIESIILSPQHWRYGEEGEIISMKKIGKRKVEVVYLSLPQFIKVLTVMVD